MTHPTNLEDESTLRDPLCWDESIKNKYEQGQQNFFVKVEVEEFLNANEQQEQKPRQSLVKEEDGRLCTTDYEPQQQQHVVMKLGMFDVSVSLEDCLKKGTSVIPEPVKQSKFACNIPETSIEKYVSKEGQDMRLPSRLPQHPCTYCDYETTCKDNLKAHMITHTGEKPFACDVCDYKCSRKGELTKHMRTHTKEKPYVCDVCDYQCSVKSSLTVHVRTHTGERPHVCDMCDYKSATMSDLTKHKRSHTGEKPFACDGCDFKCSRKSNLTRHMHRHHKEMDGYDDNDN